MARTVELGAVVTDTFAIFDTDGVSRVSGETIFITAAIVDGVFSGVPITVSEIGSFGEYLVTFTPITVGFWKVQVYSAYDRIWRELSVNVTDKDSVAQVNVSFDDATPRMYFEAWLERTNRPVLFSSLISCELEVFDISGSSLFVETSSSPKSTGHFSLSHDTGLTSNRPYNIRVTITDTIGSITSLHGISTVG